MKSPLRSRRIRRWAWPLTLVIAAPAAHAASYVPGSEADPPTGDTAASTTPAEPLRGGNGIQWVFGPWRTGGTMALDLRWLRFDSGGSARQATLLADVEASSYLWQPWFAQLRVGLGFVASTDSNGQEGAARTASTGNTLTGQAQLSLFPVSRFPFSARFEATDSRTNIEALGTDLQTRRLSLLQSYRPPNGNDNYQLQIDASRLVADGRTDTLYTIDGQAQWLRGAHRFELGSNWADHRGDDDRQRTRLASITARHGWHPSGVLGVDSLASWYRTRTRYDDAVLALDLGSEVQQLSTLWTWRPREGDLPLAVPPNTLVVGSARWVGARTLAGGDAAKIASVNATLGASADLGAAWRLAGSVSMNQFEADDTQPARSASVHLGATWAPRSRAFGDWRYVPSLALNGGATRGSEDSDREFASAQFSHTLVRDIEFSPTDRLTWSAAQSVGLLAERTPLEDERTATLTHTLSATWHSAGDAAQQRFASASVSDYRARNGEDGSFQLVNLQWSQRTQLSRLSSWSGSLTLQATRSRLGQTDLLGGAPLAQDDGWQHFASGSLNYEHQRAFGVPRLRFSLLAGIGTQQFARRSAGDIDAPLRFTSRYAEARLDYAIGKLDARMSARAARVDERNVAAIVARVQRRF